MHLPLLTHTSEKVVFKRGMKEAKPANVLVNDGIINGCRVQKVKHAKIEICYQIKINTIVKMFL